MKQKHYGSGDNVNGSKIGKQINLGPGSTYNESQGSTAPKSEPAKNEAEKLAETPSGVLSTLLGWLPKPFRPIVAIAILGLVIYVGYHYFMPKTPTSIGSEKVYVSGVIHINNGEPRPNEIKSMRLRDIDANPARFDSKGVFTFTGVKIPDNKRLLVDVTFADGKTVPTDELMVGEADKETKTIRLPDLYATRPQAATKSRPASDWKIQLNVNTGSGTQNPTQN